MKRIVKCVLVVFLTLLTLLGLQPGGVMKRVETGEYVVPAGETLHGALFISSPGVVTIEEGGKVDGPIFMGSGVLNANGEVGGGIFSLSGDVHLGPQAVVDGHVTVTSVPYENTAGARVKNDLATDVSGWMGGPVGAALVLLVLAGYLLYGSTIRRLIFNRSEEGKRLRGEVFSRGNLLPAAGVVLLTAAVVGVAWLAGGERAAILWMLAILVPGVALGALLVADPQRRAALAVPTALLLVTGLLLLVQTVTGYWQSWAYVWALVLPVAVGLGRLVQGRLERDARRERAGLRLAGIGLALAALSVAVIAVAELGGWAILWLPAALLVVAGGFLLIGRLPGERGRAAGG